MLVRQGRIEADEPVHPLVRAQEGLVRFGERRPLLERKHVWKAREDVLRQGVPRARVTEQEDVSPDRARIIARRPWFAPGDGVLSLEPLGQPPHELEMALDASALAEARRVDLDHELVHARIGNECLGRAPEGVQCIPEHAKCPQRLALIKGLCCKQRFDPRTGIVIGALTQPHARHYQTGQRVAGLPIDRLLRQRASLLDPALTGREGRQRCPGRRRVRGKCSRSLVGRERRCILVRVSIRRPEFVPEVCRSRIDGHRGLECFDGLIDAILRDQHTADVGDRERILGSKCQGLVQQVSRPGVMPGLGESFRLQAQQRRVPEALARRLIRNRPRSRHVSGSQ